MKKSLIITSCTNRKRKVRINGLSQLGEKLSLADIKTTTHNGLQKYVKNWAKVLTQSLTSTHPKVPAGKLYVGRSITEIEKSCMNLSASCYFISAGLGFIPTERNIPSYDVSFIGKNTDLSKILKHYKTMPSSWWNLLCKDSPYSDNFETVCSSEKWDYIYLCLPNQYLKLIQPNLEKFDSYTKEKIRIFSSEEGIRKSVPENMKNNCFEYDERLNSCEGFSGTRSDFPHRSLAHFSIKIYKEISPKKSTQQLRTDVAKLMSLLEKPTLVGSKENGKRVRKSNEEIKRWIEKNWQDSEGRCSVLLPRYRKTEGFACEQSRFSKLWRQVKEKKDNHENYNFFFPE